ncbi:MAG: ATP-binding protein [Coriobacteriia bacterium]|nr:ATP-binding protein [Coriobacteriia bacterium]
MAAQFEISTGDCPGACVISFSGDIDLAVTPEIRGSFEEVHEHGHSNVILDLTQAAYVDSTFLGLLVWFDQLLHSSQGRLLLVGANSDVMRIFRLSGFLSIAACTSVSANLQDAVEELDLPKASPTPLWERETTMGGDASQIAHVREEVYSMLESLEFPEQIMFDWKVAVGEALANAVQHGVPKSGTGSVRVCVRAYCDRAVVEVADNGTGFKKKRQGGLDIYAASGRGIMFMRALMDRVEIDSPALGGTVVRLVKYRPSAT